MPLRAYLLAFTLLSVPGGLLAQAPGSDSLVCPSGSVPRADSSTHPAVSVRLDSLPPNFDDIVARVLKRLGYEEVTYNAPERAWSTAPYFKWPPGSEREPWHGRNNPGYRVVFSVAPGDGGGFQLTSAASALCHFTAPDRDHPPEKVEMMVAMLASMQVMGEVNRALPRAGH